MDFQEFWDKLSDELKTNKQFETLARPQVFDIKMDAPDQVTYTPVSTGKPHTPKIEQFQDIWNMIKNDIRSERYKGTNDRFRPFYSSSYVCALIDHIVQDQDME